MYIGGQHVASCGAGWFLKSNTTVVMRKKLFHQAHGGVYGDHLGDKKAYSEIQHHYWWSRMWSDINHWSKGCLACVTYSRGQSVQAPLTPVSVSGPWD